MLNTARQVISITADLTHKSEIFGRALSCQPILPGCHPCLETLRPPPSQWLPS
jgi:hypothetical protein